MFRQTLIRGAAKRNLEAGATNEKVPKKDQVSITLHGHPNDVAGFVSVLEKFAAERKPINSWGATIEKLEKLESGKDLHQHQVTTTNVDDRNWKQGVEFYL
jgi:acylphosphatase